MTTKRKIGIAFLYLELILVALVVLYPIAWVVITAFSADSRLSRATLIPEAGLYLDNFRRLFTKTNYITWYKNTAYIAVLTMIFAVILNVMTCFIFARYSFKGKKAGMLILSILQMFPVFSSLTAIYMIALNFGMLNNLNTLVILYVVGGIPGNIWLVKGFMSNISKSLDEAAYIDGASKIQVFWKIIFPLSKPIVSYIAVMSFMGPWLDYILPRYLINNDKKTTLAVGLFELTDPLFATYDFRAFAAGAILIGLPIAGLYMYLQKFLMGGMMDGAVKGD